MDTATDVLAELTHAPTMGALEKVRYTHVDMIDFIIGNPGCTQRRLAARYGYSESWISNIMQSDAWKSQMARRRSELIDPVLGMTMNEKFAALADRSLRIVMEKLDRPNVPDRLALEACALGAKAIGIGGNAPPAAPREGDHLANLANRLIDLQSTMRKGIVYENGETTGSASKEVCGPEPLAGESTEGAICTVESGPGKVAE